jgi:multiple antibiotic resistance protein
MEIGAIVFKFFLLSNPVGNSPAIVSLLKGIDFHRQKRIMLRESFFALLIGIFFLYMGKTFLGLLGVEQYTLSLCSGMLLFLVAFEMIFPRHDNDVQQESLKREPFIVPIATPLISGPSFMTIVMLYAAQEPHLKVLSAMCIAWIGVTAVLCSAPYLQKVLGNRGLVALEQLMGMLLAMMAVETAISGLHVYISQISN